MGLSNRAKDLLHSALGSPEVTNEVVAAIEAPAISSLNNLSGNVTLAQGSNVTITPSGNTLTISASGGGGSPLTTKGDIFGYSTVDARIPIGTDNQVLTADSTQPLGLKWADSGGGGSPGGADTNVQFNDGGSSFGGTADLTFDKTNVQFGIGAATPTSTLEIDSQGGTGTFLTGIPAIVNIIQKSHTMGHDRPYHIVLSSEDGGAISDIGFLLDTTSTYNGTGQLSVVMNDGDGGQITPFTIHKRDDTAAVEISSFAQLNMKGNDVIDVFSVQFHNVEDTPTTYYVKSIDHLSTHPSDSVALKSGDTVDGNTGDVLLKPGTPSGTGIRGKIDATSSIIKNVTNPVSAQDAATKAYVDGASYSARAFSATTTISSSLATIVYATEDYDSGNNYDNTTGIFTAPVSGKYIVNAGLLMTGTISLNNTLIMEIQKNGSVVSRKTIYLPAALTDGSINISDTINCSVTDTIKIRVSTSAVGPSIVSSNFDNYLSIVKA